MFLKTAVNSVRFKITLWYSFTLLIALSVFSFFLYNQQKKALDEYSDEVIAVKGEDTADAIETYLKTRSGEGNKKKSGFLDRKFFESIVNNHMQDPGLVSISIRIADIHGDIIANSANMMQIHGISREALAESMSGNAYYETLQLNSGNDKIVYYRSYTTPVQIEGKAAYIVQVLKPLHNNRLAMKALLENILIFIPITIMLTGFLGMSMAGLSLKPVNDIIRTTRQINAENLHLRIPAPNTRDEIRELADLFNEMLSRIESAFLSQRRFIQDVSHELKTPLTIVKGEIEVALKKTRTEQEYNEVLKSNLEEINRISRLVENLLTLAKLESSGNEGPSPEINPNDALIQAAGKIKKLAEAKNIKVELDLSPEKLQVKANEMQIISAFFNVMENAVKYSPEGTCIRIKTFPSNGGFMVDITDEGPGIEPESLPHIFERFYRADASRSSEGFGLGLSIAKSALENCGASIKAENAPGKGAKFLIIFPQPQAQIKN